MTLDRGTNEGSKKHRIPEVLRPRLSKLRLSKKRSFLRFLMASFGGTVTNAPIQHRQVESGDCRSNLPVAELMCIARLTFLNCTIVFKLFLVIREAVPNKTYLEECPQ